MPATHLLEGASDILFGDSKWHEKFPFLIGDEEKQFSDPRTKEPHRVSYMDIVRELETK